jgi:trk system potassium uptake protein TrkH
MSRAGAKQSETMKDLPLARDAGEGAGAATALWLGVAFALSLIIGFVVMRLPGAMTTGHELSIERVLFIVANAATGTGFQQNVAIDQYGAVGKACVFALMAIGTITTLIIGGMAVVRVAGMDYSDGQIIRTTIITYVLSVFAGAALLAEPHRGLVPSAMQAASAVGNSGLVLGSLPPLLDWRTHLVLMPLALLGGLGVPVILDLCGFAFGRGKPSTHTRVVLALVAAVYLAGVIACMPWGSAWSTGVATSSAQSINARTAGLPIASLSTFSRMAQWLIIGLMIIGAAPGGAGGGLKVTALYHIQQGTVRALRRERGKRIVGIAAVWMLSYTAIVIATLLALLALQPEMPPDRLLFISISAVSLAGLSHDPISMTGGGLDVLAFAMLLGRVVPWLILWWAATTLNADEPDVAVG